MTRESGFSVRSPVVITAEKIDTYSLEPGDHLTFTFALPEADPGERVGFGGWFTITENTEVSLRGAPTRSTLKIFDPPNWSKVGSQWVLDGNEPTLIELSFLAHDRGAIAVYGLRCGVIEHEHFVGARPSLLARMHESSPESNIYVDNRTGQVSGQSSSAIERGRSTATLYLKSCNRCGRDLPVNVHDERAQLSFGNHCVSRAPCTHSGFGYIRDANSGERHDLHYGFQLECRFCKKFEVNAALNPQRTVAQMREDGHRRRAFELLLEYLYEGSDQLRYRHVIGRELADDIYTRFDGRCYKCGTAFASPRDMQLDHTRPLALLWPLDGTATALCPTCNSDKRDRPPSEFYTPSELEGLSELTGLPLEELQDPSPNMEALELLKGKSDWFCDDFLQRDELQEVRDGKRAADLLVKALDKALRRTPGAPPYLASELCDGDSIR